MANVAIVTAAGRGIGEACARELAARGYELSVMSPTNSVKLSKELGCFGMGGSVTNLDDLKALVDATIKRHGRIDAVINNTAHAPATFHGTRAAYDPDHDRSPLEVTDEQWHEGVDVLLLNVVRMARLVTPLMQKQGGGAFVNISTFAALEPRITYPVSGSIRLALAGFTKLYADRHARDGIRMNNMLPGVVENWPAEPAIIRTIPMGRSAKLSEVAKTAAFLVSPDAGYITGQNILVDGGVNRGI
jgi:NAD(P)-dependent dehydrogenase (short-subunit alcohol dehydrogenase family)